MPAFKVGDVVQLKSGGPPMTVEDVGDLGRGPDKGAKCTWFDDKRKRCTEVFHADTLELADMEPMGLDVG